MTPISPRVLEFVGRYLRSLEDLQVLLACATGQDRWWDASSMAQEVGIGTTAAQRSLDQLARGNLLDIRLTAEVRYQFNPGTSELRELALACAAEYRTNPIGVVQLVGDARRRSVRDFADAFKFRKP